MKTKKYEDKVLLTHFTHVSYGVEYQITETGKVNYSNTTNLLGLSKFSFHNSHYEEGSFLVNREKVYEMLYTGGFTHVFSGHSHRAGYYTMTGMNGAAKEVTVQGHLIGEKPIHPTELLNGGKVRLIVGASGGPIPVQNHYASKNEIGLSKWSLDIPSGNVMMFTHDSLHLKPTKNIKAKPRFATALSFFNTTPIKVGDSEVTGVFQQFESGDKKNIFEIKLHDALPSEKFIKNTVLNICRVANKVVTWKYYNMEMTDNGLRKYKLQFSDLNEQEVDAEIFNEINTKFYMSINFASVLKNKIGYKQYNYDSPWIFPVHLVNKKEEAMSQAAYNQSVFGVGGQVVYQDDMDEARKVSGYRFELNENVPNFQWYRKTFSAYATKEPSARTRVSDESYP